MRGGSSSSPGCAEGLQHCQPPPEGAALLTERLSTGCPALTAAVFKQHGAEAEGPRWGERTTANLGSERPASVELGRQAHTEEGLGLGPPRALQGVPRGGLIVP